MFWRGVSRCHLLPTARGVLRVRGVCCVMFSGPEMLLLLRIPRTGQRHRHTTHHHASGILPSRLQFSAGGSLTMTHLMGRVSWQPGERPRVLLNTLHGTPPEEPLDSVSGAKAEKPCPCHGALGPSSTSVLNCCLLSPPASLSPGFPAKIWGDVEPTSHGHMGW